MNHQGVVAFVTGGASGLGEASVLELIKKGAAVVIADVDTEKGESLAAGIGSKRFFVKADVNSATEIKHAIEKAVKN